jgi:hypothetical protein
MRPTPKNIAQTGHTAELLLAFGVQRGQVDTARDRFLARNFVEIGIGETAERSERARAGKLAPGTNVI